MPHKDYFESYFSILLKCIKQSEYNVSNNDLLNKAIAKRNKEIKEVNKNEK